MTPEAPRTVTLADVKAAIAARAAADPAFRAALLADPKAAVAQALGTDLPAHVTIQVVEEAPDTHVVVLPAPAAAGELSDADLEAVAGGSGKESDTTIAKYGASLVFGGGIGVVALGIASLARAAKNPKGDAMILTAGDIMTCGAGREISAPLKAR